MPTAPVNGTNLYYELVGEGIPCIALHGGLGMDHTYLKATFGSLNDQLRFIYVDQRGNGRSDRPPSETITLAQLAADVEALRDQLGFEKIALLGHSFGGFIALEHATTFPESLSHLILLDTSPGKFEPTPEELAERPDPSTVSPEAREAAQKLFSVPPASDEASGGLTLDHARAYLHKQGPAVLFSAFSDVIFDLSTMILGFMSFAGWSVADKLDRITCPTLVVCGRYDLQTTPECSKRLSTAIPDAELLWLENSGHFPWVEEPDTFFAAVEEWLSRHN